MILRDVDNIKVGSTSVNKVYQGNYKVYDKNKIVLEGYCKQNTTTGKNLLNVEATTPKTFINKKNGNVGNSNDWSATDFIPIEANSTYILSGIKNGWSGSAGTTYYDYNKAYISSVESTIYTFNTPSNARYIRISLNSETPTNVMLEKGSIATDYEPYTGGIASPNPNYPQEIEVMEGKQVVNVKGQDFEVDLESKNKLPPTNNTTITSNGVTCVCEDGIYTLTGETPSSGGSNITIQLTEEYKIKSGDYLHIGNSVVNSNISISLLNGSTAITQPGFSTVNRILNLSSCAGQTVTAIRFYTAKETATNVTVKPMIVNNISTATDYEPYYNYKLAGIGDYKDNIYTKEGKWYVKSLMGKVVLDGSENWDYNSNYNYFRVSNYNFENKIPLKLTYDNKKSYNQYCNLFKINKDWSGANSFRDSTTTQGIFYPVQDLGYKLCFRNTNYQNVSDFKTWLSTHNTEVYYVLATPTEEEITSPTLIQQLNRLYQAM